MVLSIIVAAAENNVIGRDNGLIWRLSADLKRFKALTTGHTILMGRKTFESNGRELPNRRSSVITRTLEFAAGVCEAAHHLEEALELTQNEDEIVVTGGGTIYKKLWDKADRLYLTVVHQECEGDTVIPSVDPEVWREVAREVGRADEKNECDYTFINYERVK